MFRTWLEREHERGKDQLDKITSQRRQLHGETSRLAQFGKRMALVRLTGSVSSWAKEVHDGLSEAGHVEAAALFASGPPFAATNPTSGDYDLLDEYVAACIRVLQDLLDRDGEPDG